MRLGPNGGWDEAQRIYRALRVYLLLLLSNYFLWGYLKSIVYKNEYRTIDDSKRKIKQVCNEHTSTDVCERAVRDYQRRLQKCVERGGKHIEV